MYTENDTPEQVALVSRGEGAVVATAIHDGHTVRPDLIGKYAIGEFDRLREEDPHTGLWTEVASTRIVATHSRFEFDLNRPRESAIYRIPADAWGLAVWLSSLPEEEVERSLASYDQFYRETHDLLDNLAERYGRFVVLDLHSYNHRRAGPNEESADPAVNPEVNIGTGYIDRDYWAPVIDQFIDNLRAQKVCGRKLDVRENVKFKGGAFPRWVQENYPLIGCPIAVEFKKTFMDEWTGELFEDVHAAIKDALQATIGELVEELRRFKIHKE